MGRRRRKRRKTRRKRGRGPELNSLLRHKGQRRGTHSSKPHGRRASPGNVARLERHRTRRAPPPPPQPTDSPTAFTDINLGQQMRERGRRAQLVRSGTPTFGEQFKGTGAGNLAARRPLSVSEHHDANLAEYIQVGPAKLQPSNKNPGFFKRLFSRSKKKKKKTRADRDWERHTNSGGRRRRSRRRRRRRRRSRSKRGGANECCISTKCPPKGYSLVKNAPPPPPPPGPTAASGATKQGSQAARGALLGSIQGFKKGALKKASKAKSKKASKGKGGLLAAIRAGTKLKPKAEQTKLKPKPKAQRSALQAAGNEAARKFQKSRGEGGTKANGDKCKHNRECESQYCDPATNECEDEPAGQW